MVAVIALIILAIAIITGIIGVLMVRKRKKEGKLQADYRTFYILGVIWVPFSIVFMVVSFIFQIPFYTGFPLFAVGIIYLVIGLANRDKWRKNKPK
jgi:ABC-type transport system involved in multi-copper enzyme maturation permease subunit